MYSNVVVGVDGQQGGQDAAASGGRASRGHPIDHARQRHRFGSRHRAAV
jgi:hypothetical protein